MQIVIKIPERIHYGIEKGITVNGSIASQVLIDAVKNGIPLPKGHGRLIDADDIRVIELEDSLHIIRHEKGDEIDVYIDTPTIIEADKEQEDNGFFDEIMDDSEDGEVYEKIKEIIAKVKEQE